MKLQTKIAVKPAARPIDYQSRLLLLGSCFATNMGEKLDYYKFRSLQNPLGILFHPLAIEKLISRAVAKERFHKSELFQLNEQWHCFDAHSALSATSKEELLSKLNAALDQTYQGIREATHMFITLGTAWCYRHTATEKVVANCHKVAQNQFSKQLLPIDRIEKSLQNMLQLLARENANANITITVSPVRHLKDGFVENQRSKAHLIAAVHNTLKKPDLEAQTTYFPAYEIMMDELRDYRFYDDDMVHPNRMALHYIWEKFAAAAISAPAHDTMAKVDAVQKGLLHRPFNAASEEHTRFVASLDKKIAYLQQEYPHMKFDA